MPDSRDNGLYLRATWHPDGRQFVVSTWSDDICTGAVRVPVEQGADLVSLFADGLAEAAATPVATAPAPRRAWRQRLRHWLVAHGLAAEPPAPEPTPIRFRDTA